jgi:circadian clock protein KaiB
MTLVLRLYVAGSAPNSVRAISNAQAVCEAHFATDYELEIVDLLEHPQRALTDGVIVTPTLIRLLPLPIQKVVGTLSDAKQLLLVLGGE